VTQRVAAIALALLCAAAAFAGGARIILPGTILNPPTNATLPAYQTPGYFGPVLFEYEWIIKNQPARPVLYTINGQSWGPLAIAPGECIRLEDRTDGYFLRGRVVLHNVYDAATQTWGTWKADCAARPDQCPRVKIQPYAGAPIPPGTCSQTYLAQAP
jgi:hypothetical protein